MICPRDGNPTVYQPLSGGTEMYCSLCDSTYPLPDVLHIQNQHLGQQLKMRNIIAQVTAEIDQLQRDKETVVEEGVQTPTE